VNLLSDAGISAATCQRTRFRQHLHCCWIIVATALLLLTSRIATRKAFALQLVRYQNPDSYSGMKLELLFAQHLKPTLFHCTCDVAWPAYGFSEAREIGQDEYP
jgi:hypothetical protein